MISPNRECSAFPIKIKIDKADVGLENVDNTSDLDKPISNAVRDYLDGAKDSVSTNVALAKEYSENAKTSETNCETIEAKIDALNVATVDTAQNITGAKTFAGETTITGPLGVSGDTALAGKVTVEKELNLDSNGSATFNGILTASNTANALKVADHTSVLTGNDVLNAKDIMTANGGANNLVHRSGNETIYGEKIFNGQGRYPHAFDITLDSINSLADGSRWQKVIDIKTTSRINISLIKIHFNNFQVVNIDCNGDNPEVTCFNCSTITKIGRTRFCIAKRVDTGYYELWACPLSYASDTFSIWEISIYSVEQSIDERFVFYRSPTIAAKPVVGDTYSVVVDDKLMSISTE